jgi:hypothetical protein
MSSYVLFHICESERVPYFAHSKTYWKKFFRKGGVIAWMYNWEKIAYLDPQIYRKLSSEKLFSGSDSFAILYREHFELVEATEEELNRITHMNSLSHLKWKP